MARVRPTDLALISGLELLRHKSTSIARTWAWIIETDPFWRVSTSRRIRLNAPVQSLKAKLSGSSCAAIRRSARSRSSDDSALCPIAFESASSDTAKCAPTLPALIHSDISGVHGPHTKVAAPKIRSPVLDRTAPDPALSSIPRQLRSSRRRGKENTRSCSAQWIFSA